MRVALWGTKGRGLGGGARRTYIHTHLERQLAGVAHHDGGHLALLPVQLLQHGQDEHRGLAHPGFGLAQDVHAQNGVGDALMLHCRGTHREREDKLDEHSVWRGNKGEEKGGGGCYCARAP